VIRRARPGEADALTDLAVRSKAQWGYGEAFMAAASSELIVHEADLERLDVLVIEREGALVAFAALDFGADQPELDALFVDEEWIGSGLGGALLEAACTVARKRGVDALVIESDPNAEEFYRRHGAVSIGERRSESTGRTLPLLRIATAGSASGGA
jgi:N-acetylglutamate synthase-like GNAT family acetyltransferase